MALIFELTSNAPPDVVLDAIARRAAYWQESLVPADLRSRGVIGVTARVKHNTFFLACDPGITPSTHLCVAIGKVDRAAGGGSVLRARIGLQSAWPKMTGFILPILLLSASGAAVPWIGLVPLGICAVLAVLYFRAKQNSFDPSDPLCTHLKARIEVAVAEASLPSASPTAERL